MSDNDEFVKLLNDVTKKFEVEGYGGPLDFIRPAQWEEHKDFVELLTQSSRELEEESKKQSPHHRPPAPTINAKKAPIAEEKLKNEKLMKEMQNPSKKSKEVHNGVRRFLEKSKTAIGNKSDAHLSFANRDDPYSEKFGISYQTIEELCDGLDSGKILNGSSYLLKVFHTESFYKRLDYLWPDVKKQANFLRIIVATADPNQAVTLDFLYKVLSSKLVEHVTVEQISLLPDNTNLHTTVYAKLAENLLKLLVLGFNMIPLKMDNILDKAQLVLSCLNEVSKANEKFLFQNCLKELGRLDNAIKKHFLIKAKSQKENDMTHEPILPPAPKYFGKKAAPKNRELSFEPPTPDDYSLKSQPYLRLAKILEEHDIFFVTPMI